jgi:hypothetical protein
MEPSRSLNLLPAFPRWGTLTQRLYKGFVSSRRYIACLIGAFVTAVAHFLVNALDVSPQVTLLRSLIRCRVGKSVFRIRSRKFLGLPDPDPLVRGKDPDPSIIKQK